MANRTKHSRQKNDLPENTEYRPINWKKVFAPKYIPLHVLALGITAATIYISVKHDQVVGALRPFSEKIRELPAGWLIPVAILVLISIPPLFGHELVALLCGVVYGLWVGFAIVAAGTFLGEILTWFLFKHTLRRKAIKLERTNLNYGALARLTRDRGFWIILVIRFSAIPSHFSTAVFSTCDVNFWSYAIATALTLPKQIFLVYFGVILVQNDQENKDNTVKTIMVSVAAVITIIMAGYIYYTMRGIKTTLLEKQAKRRVQGDTSKPNETLARGRETSIGSEDSYRRSRLERAPFQQRDIVMDDMDTRAASPHGMI